MKVTGNKYEILNTKYETELIGRYLVAGGLFEESNIGQKSNNHDQGESYSYFDINISKINHDFNPFLNQIATNKQIIPRPTLTVNNPSLARRVILENGTPKATINQPADKLISNYE